MQAGTAARRERSSDIARAVIDQLDQQGWDVAKLVEDLQTAAQGRHVMAWSSNRQQERGWQGAGISGRLRADSLLVALQNRGGNKLDQFLGVIASIEHRPVKNGSEVTVRINVRNDTPTEGLNTFVEGPFPQSGFVAGQYHGILSVNVPGVAGDVTLEGGTKIVTAGRDGQDLGDRHRDGPVPGGAEAVRPAFPASGGLRAPDDRAVGPVSGDHVDRRREALDGQQRPALHW